MNPYKPPHEPEPEPELDPPTPPLWMRVIVLAYLAFLVFDQVCTALFGFEEWMRLGPFSIGGGRWPW